MSTEIERVKRLITDDLLVAAIELPAQYKNKPLVVDDLEEALSIFDEDADYAHFVIRVRRSGSPLPKPLENPQNQQLSIDSMVNETLEMSERITKGRALDEAEHDPDFLLESAKLLEENGDHALARNIYQTLVRKGLMIAPGLSGMARTYEKEGDGEKAIRCYQEAIAYSSELSFYQGLAAVQIRIGQDMEAAKTILHALGLPGLKNDQRFELYKSAGNCFTRLGDFPKAEHHYRKAYELNAASDILQVNVGSLALQKGDIDAALRHFEKAIEINPRSDKAMNGMGMAWMAKGEPRKAHQSFIRCLAANLGNISAVYNLVKCSYELNELKEFAEAAKILRLFIEKNEFNANILYSYAGILYHQGEYALASIEAGKILQADPSHAGAKELIALISKKSGHEG